MDRGLSLPPLEIIDLTTCALPDIWPRFHIPRLADKPQNPIMDTLHHFQNDTHKVHYQTTPSANTKFRNVAPRLDIEDSFLNNVDIWKRASTRKTISSNLMSWDTLRHTLRVSSSPLLSEQATQKSSAARYYVRPLLQDAMIQYIHVSEHDLLKSLRLTLSGNSSALHMWDPNMQVFSSRRLRDGQKQRIVLLGKDEIISESLIDRFLTIGMLMRRLEIFVSDLSISKLGSTFHAFMYAVLSVFEYCVGCVEKSPLLQPTCEDRTSPDALATIWMWYGDLETLLTELSSFCGMGPELFLSAYTPISSSSAELLSGIYKQLKLHVERQSPKPITAVFAFILTSTSRVYFERISRSVGYDSSSSMTSSSTTLTNPGRDQRPYAFLDNDLPIDQDHAVADEEEETRGHPTFLPPGLSEGLHRARRSLKLLRVAVPDHSLLCPSHSPPAIEWIWTESATEADKKGKRMKNDTTPVQPASNPAITEQTELTYKRGLEEFRLFDLPPDVHDRTSRTSNSRAASSLAAFDAFLQMFPANLPSITPTLVDLTGLVLSPLMEHISTLSGALVQLFLSPNSYLHLHSHLVLLRSYLLLTSHSFKTRLEFALFSDIDEESQVALGAAAITRAQVRTRSTSSLPTPADESAGSSWVIGLSPDLTEGGSWPPGGAHLSFLLRTVIMDSLQLEYGHRTRSLDEPTLTNSEERVRILEEAEWRLGFAIRDLHIGSEAKWLNPRSIEALDFLYMEYQPPHPLDVVITPTILSKYHRVFAFNLRLLRVSNVVRALYRMTRNTSTPLFPTFNASNKLFLHFRFIAHSFATSVSSYVYDIAVGSNFDAFLAALSPQHNEESLRSFSDVFALADYHSSVLDDILSACLLRSGQKAAGDLLRGALDLVLELGLLMSDRRKGTLEEYEAVPLLDTLFTKFRSKMITLVKVLAALVGRGPTSVQVISEAKMSTRSIPQAARSAACLADLFTRLDAANWWRQGVPST